MSNSYLSQTNKGISGFALVEGLVAIAILAFGILGLVALQGQMVKANSETRYRAQAALMTNELTGQMWLNQVSLGTNWAIAEGACGNTANAACVAWLKSVSDTLPSGTATVSFVGNVAQITITWQSPGEVAHRFQSEATINN